MKLSLRIIIFVIIGLIIFWGLSLSNPRFTMDDLYIVSGYCSDIQYEDIYAKNGSERVYVVMDNGERYYIYNSLWKGLDAEQKNIKGCEISFFASDKSKHWVYDHLFFALSSDTDDCIESVRFVNKQNITTRAIALLGYCVMMSLYYLAPAILLEMEKRDHKQPKVRRK